MSQVPGRPSRRRPRPAYAAVWLVLGALGALALRRRAGRTGPVPASPPAARHPVRVTLPADRQRHDGRAGTQRQLVFLDGGPADGSRVALGWQAVRHQVHDADRGTWTYLDSGRTRPDALGQPARVFTAQPPEQGQAGPDG